MLQSLFFYASFMYLVHNGMTSSCDKVTSCKCKMSDGSGDVDLTSLQGKGGQPRFKDVLGTEDPPQKYSWNPCTVFNEGGDLDCVKVAVCQVYSFGSYWSGGSQDSAKFSVAGNGQVSVTYMASDSSTTSTVDLICDKSAKDPVFIATGDPQTTNNIKLSLKHACSCPGMCDDSGIVPEPSGGSAGTLSIGTILIIVVIVLLPIYLVGGMVYNIKLKHETGARIFPNVDFWTALPGYIKDGFKFTLNETIRRGQYQEL